MRSTSSSHPGTGVTCDSLGVTVPSWAWFGDGRALAKLGNEVGVWQPTPAHCQAHGWEHPGAAEAASTGPGLGTEAQGSWQLARQWRGSLCATQQPGQSLASHPLHGELTQHAQGEIFIRLVERKTRQEEGKVHKHGQEAAMAPLSPSPSLGVPNVPNVSAVLQRQSGHTGSGLCRQTPCPQPARTRGPRTLGQKLVLEVP